MPKEAELLAQVDLGSGSGRTVAWCPVTGLLAVGARQHAGLACVHVLSPQCLEHKVTLAVPLQGMCTHKANKTERCTALPAYHHSDTAAPSSRSA